MSIIDRYAVEIHIANLSKPQQSSILRLDYQGRKYDLIQAFASHKVELVLKRLQQLIAIDRDAETIASLERYLVVRESDYYSLWMISPSLNLANTRQTSNSGLELQQASIWLFQELWLQWQDLLGENQLPIFVEHLLTASSQIQSKADLDRLLNLDPLGFDRLSDWSELDFIAFDRQLSQLTQKKIGHKFGTTIIVDILTAMPDSLRSTLTNILALDI